MATAGRQGEHPGCHQGHKSARECDFEREGDAARGGPDELCAARACSTSCWHLLGRGQHQNCDTIAPPWLIVALSGAVQAAVGFEAFGAVLLSGEGEGRNF